MPGDVFLDLVKAAWKAAHNLVSPPVMAEARDIMISGEILAAGARTLRRSTGLSV